MDSSRLTEIRRNQSMAAFVQINPSMNNFNSELEVVYKNLGGQPVLFEGRLVGMQPSEDNEIYKIKKDTVYTQEELIQIAIINALSDLFTFMANSNSGPTICARIMYLFFFSITSSYNGVVGGKTGTHDNWNWSKSYILNADTLYIWIQQTLAYCLPKIITTGWGNGITTFSPAFTVFSNDWDLWFATRNTDNGQLGGSARSQPTSTQVPNIATFLDVYVLQDISGFPRPAEWTPLSYNSGGTKQNYLTYGWGTVKSPSLPPVDETAIITAQSTPVYSSGSRNDEILDLLDKSEILTDTEKVIAEFWEGGANTITPPGMCLWFWKEYILSQGLTNLNILFFSGLDLSIAIFEASRLCWNIKGINKQARPIQEIRRNFLIFGNSAKKYDGTTIDTRLWVPYQRSNTLTPPFADFPSGHSTFSQIFARVMTDWFGPNIQSQKVQAPFSQIRLLSPILNTSQSGPFGTFTVSTGASGIQAGVVPASPVTLSFTTWQQMADQAGMSRQYGGIHAASAHSGGQALANAIRPVQKANWPLI
jgi:hypothetical protein